MWNRYNQTPHLTQYTNGNVTTSQTRAERSALSKQVTTRHQLTDAQSPFELAFDHTVSGPLTFKEEFP